METSKNIKERIKKISWYKLAVYAITFIGIFLRFKGYLSNSSFWHDECALAWNVKFKSYLGLFGVLNFLQVAPPFFSILSKLLASAFGYSEAVLRFVPFVIGCFTIPAFYILSKQVLKTKLSLLTALFLFSTNLTLINYSFEFKPYILDVFFATLCMLFFIKMNLSSLSNKRAWLYSLLFAFLPWLSFPSIFVLAGGFSYLLFKDIKKDYAKKLILILPFFLSCLFYLKLYLINNYSASVSGMNVYWQNYFITFNFKHFFLLLAKDFKYLLAPIYLVLFSIIFFLWGFILFVKEKSSFIKVFLPIFAFVAIASLLHLYPFAERLILFLLPLFLILIVKPLDTISPNKKFFSGFLTLIFALTFYPQVQSTMDFIKAKALDKNEHPREMMAFLAKRLKQQDKIFVNNSSDAEFAYYASSYKIKNQTIQDDSDIHTTKQTFIKKLDSLENGYYWFYLPIDYINIPVTDWIEAWAAKKKIISTYNFKEKYKSLLIYVYIKN